MIREYKEAALLVAEAVVIGLCLCIGLIGFVTYVLLVNGSLPL